MRDYLRYRFSETCKEECCRCGTTLRTLTGEPLSRYFVMDVQGNFYCTECDTQFEDDDERIYMGDEDNE